MQCPYCLTEDTKVLETRENDNSTRRRRECLKCEKRFTTYERVESLDITVIKKNGSKESFDREKFKRSLLKACEKRPVTLEVIDKNVDKLETKLRSLNSTEINSKFLGQIAMRALKTIDNVAYIRFASIYKEFEDVGDYEKEIIKIKGVIKNERTTNSNTKK